MAIYLVSDDIANAQLDVIEVQTGASAILEIWDGAVINLATDSGNKLVSMVLPVNEWADAAARQKLINGPWTAAGTASILSGTARSGVIKTAGGVAKQRFDVGATGSGATMILSSTAIVAGVAFQINTFTLTRP